jgi:RHS repeat-associated protein
MRSGAATTNSQTYTGREDDGTGVYYYRERYYSPVNGRFISEDPIGLAGGMNAYGYVHHDPLGLRDPYGLFGWTDMPDFPQPVVDGAAGFGDGMSLGLTRLYRWWRDIDSVDTCSTTYEAGNWVAFAVGLGRMAYAASAAWGAAGAASGSAASAFREGLKRSFGGGGAYRRFNPGKYANAQDPDFAMRLGAGRTNPIFNGLGAGAMGAGASGGSGCSCGGN